MPNYPLTPPAPPPNQGLLQEESQQQPDMNQMVGQFGNTPIEQALKPETEATPEQQAQKEYILGAAGEFLYGNDLATVATILQRGELFEEAGKIAFEIMKKAKMDMEADGIKPDAAPFFAETGVIPELVDMIYDIAEKAGFPTSGSDDARQASVIYVYGAAKEFMQKTGDHESLAQIEELGFEMAYGPQAGMSRVPGGERNPIAEAINRPGDRYWRHSPDDPPPAGEEENY